MKANKARRFKTGRSKADRSKAGQSKAGQSKTKGSKYKIKDVMIDKSAIIKYDDKDPRYRFTIEDSDEYTKNIYPMHMREACNTSKSYADFAEYEFPLISRCWGERYEHCAVLKPVTHNGIVESAYCSCPKCAMGFYDTIDDTLGDAIITDNQIGFANYKKQNSSTIYDKTRIFDTDGLDIPNVPDDIPPDMLDQIEHMGGIGGEVVGGAFKTSGDAIEGCVSMCVPSSYAERWGWSPISSILCVFLLMMLLCAVCGIDGMMFPPMLYVPIILCCTVYYCSSYICSAYQSENI